MRAALRPSASGRACRRSTSCTWPTWTRWPPASISCRRTAGSSFPRGDAPELVPALHERLQGAAHRGSGADGRCRAGAAGRGARQLRIDRCRAADLARRMPAHLPRQAAPDGRRAGQGADPRQRAADRGGGRSRRIPSRASPSPARARGRAASPRSTAAPISTSSPRTAR